MTTPEPGIQLVRIEANVCELCLDGADGECHIPGCSFWSRDAPTGDALEWLRDQRDQTRLLATAEPPPTS